MKKLLAVATTLALPVVSFAQYIPQGGNDYRDIVGIIQGILKVAIPILITLAVIWFLVSVLKYIMADADKKKEAGTGVLHAALGVFAAVAIWGIVAFISKSLGVGVGGSITNDFIVNVEQQQI